MRSPRRFGAAAALVLSSAVASFAHAEVLVQGDPSAVHVEAHQSSLREVLDAIQARFKLRYRAAEALDGPVDGIFDGPLPHVAGRILDGHDFAMKVTADEIDVLVLPQTQGAAAVLASPQAQSATAPPAVTADVRRPRRRSED